LYKTQSNNDALRNLTTCNVTLNNLGQIIKL
jgi:hypothetical protein